TLHQSGEQHDPRQRVEQLEMALADDVVDQVLSGIWKNEAGDAIDDHQAEAEQHQRPAWVNKLPYFRQGLEDLGFFDWFRYRANHDWGKALGFNRRGFGFGRRDLGRASQGGRAARCSSSMCHAERAWLQLAQTGAAS